MAKISQKDLLTFFANNYDGDVKDMISIVYGLEPARVNWRELERTNEFPYRQYQTVLESLNRNDKSRLQTIPRNDGIIWVKRDTFFAWAKKEWSHYPEVQKSYKVWQKYKKRNQNPDVPRTKKEKVIKAMEEIILQELTHELVGLSEDEAKKKVKAALVEHLPEIKSVNTLRTYINEHFRGIFAKIEN